MKKPGRDSAEGCDQERVARLVRPSHDQGFAVGRWCETQDGSLPSRDILTMYDVPAATLVQ